VRVVRTEKIQVDMATVVAKVDQEEMETVIAGEVEMES
jgi:hypothetical protein